MAKKTTKKVTRKVVKKTTKKAAKKVVKKVTKKVAAKKAAPAKKVVKKITNKKSSVVIKTSSLKIGDMAPEFTLEDQNGKMVSLKDFRGKNVVVYFYPKAMTPGCTVQACSLRDSQSKLNDANIVVLGISADPVKKLKQFESKDKLNFTLLSDPEHKLIESYGSWGMKKFMGREYMGISRQSFLIDQSGKIIHIMNKVDTKTHHDDVLNFFTNLK
jgi:peroxiredoxin Q/BCP